MTYSADPSRPVRTLAHLSDLHLGRSAKQAARARALQSALATQGVDHIIVTGDVTHHGFIEEYGLFKDIFGAWIAEGRLSVLPGNHDRLGDEVAKEIMPGRRVDVTRGKGLHLISIDSTGPHNRRIFSGHGKIDHAILDMVDAFLGEAATDDLVVVALHHHLLPLPEEMWVEKLATRFKWPYAAELRLGQALIDRLRGRCDLVLHGHRHMPKELVFVGKDQGPSIYNAGSSTDLGRFRLFTHQNGKIVTPPVWIHAL